MKTKNKGKLILNLELILFLDICVCLNNQTDFFRTLDTTEYNFRIDQKKKKTELFQSISYYSSDKRVTNLTYLNATMDANQTAIHAFFPHETKLASI
jgi:hypothetical protein